MNEKWILQFIEKLAGTNLTGFNLSMTPNIKEENDPKCLCKILNIWR